MVKIVKGKKVLTVTLSAYRNFYKSSGWSIQDNNAGNAGAPSGAGSGSSDDEWDEVTQDEEIEKPLSEMNRQELEALASRMGVSITGLNNVKQIREVIRAAM